MAGDEIDVERVVIVTRANLVDGPTVYIIMALKMGIMIISVYIRVF